MADAWDQFKDAPADDPWAQFADDAQSAKPKQPKVSTGTALIKGILDGLTFGFADELGAMMPYNQVTEGRKAAYERLNAETKAAQEQHPIASFAGNIVGGIGSGIATGGAGLASSAVRALPMAGRVAASVGAGVGTGALSGAGYSDPGERAQGAVTGGVLGGVVGAAAPAIGSVVGRNIVDPIRARIGQGANKVAGEYISRYAARDQIPLDDITGMLAAKGPEAMPVDLGKNLGVLGKYLAQKPGASMTTAEQALKPRNEGASTRIMDAFNAEVGLGQAAKGKAVDWDSALSGRISISQDDTQLLKLLRRPSMRGAWARAQELAQEEGGKMGSLDDVLRAVQEGRVTKISTRIMHYLKKGLDDALEPKRDPVTGKVISDTGKNLLEAQKRNRHDFVQILREKDPAYAKALDESGEGFRLSNSYKEGVDALTMNIRDLQKLASRKTGAELDNFRKGYVEAIQHAIAKRGEKGWDVASGLRDPERLEAVFGKDTAKKLLGMLGRESEMRGRSNSILGGSQTRLLQEVSRDLEQGPAEIPMSIGELVRMGLRSGVSATRRPPEPALDATAKFLFEKNPQQAQALLNEMLRNGTFSLPPSMWGRAITTGAAQGAGRISAQQR